MLRTIARSTILAAMIVIAGCKPPVTASDGIREAIQQHLASLKTLNLSAMNINITEITVDRNTAQAQAEFTPKNGAPAGAAMRVSYSLEKRDDKWVVTKTGSLGGAIDHPDPGANPHAQVPQGNVHGNLPNFRDLVAPSQSQDSPLPPGHPPVPSPESPK